MSRYIDLTREINCNTQVCPCDKTPLIEPFITTAEGGVNVQLMTFGTHTATHMDAPFHYFDEGKSIDQFPIERFIGTGALLDFFE